MNISLHTRFLSPAEGLSASIGAPNKAVAAKSFVAMENVKKVFFVGIGGIGMSAIARFLQSKGVAVCGYDKTSTSLTKELEKSGMVITYEDNIELLPKDVDLVIYTPAIPKDHKGLNYYQSNGYKVIKRSDALQVITERSFNICVAGTHGKTTVTSMVAHLLRDSGMGCNAFLGGIASNYSTNYWSSDKNISVVEADEYDRSFLKLNPDVAIITSMDADHLDIYGTAEAMQDAFVQFAAKLKPGGLLIAKQGLPKASALSANTNVTYSLTHTAANVYAQNITIQNGTYLFDVMINGKLIKDVTLNMGGLHNIENAVAAIAVAQAVGVSDDGIKNAISSYKGVKRRFEYIVRNEEVVYIDDYAHHPQELKVLLEGAKNLFPDHHCTVLFQPHLFSRTKDHADGFAEVLDMADQIILLPIYPARELPIEGVSSEMILERMKIVDKKIIAKEELLNWLVVGYKPSFQKGKKHLLITAGAGDIDTLVAPFKNSLTNE